MKALTIPELLHSRFLGAKLKQDTLLFEGSVLVAKRQTNGKSIFSPQYIAIHLN